jgi:hypothetical protein
VLSQYPGNASNPVVFKQTNVLFILTPCKACSIFNGRIKCEDEIQNEIFTKQALSFDWL